METKKCPKGKLDKPIADFFKNKNKKLGVGSNCKSCAYEYNTQWRLKNLKKFSAYYHKEKYRKYGREYRKRDREIVFNHYGNKCSCPQCPETNPLFFTIDHKNNDGYTYPKALRQNLYRWIIQNNFPTDLQILCYNCNCGKYRNNSICPHLL